MSKRLQDKVALVTGAGGGMGRAIVRRFLEEGAIVVAVDLPGVSLDIDELPRCHAYAADVSSSDDVQAMFAYTVEHCGGLDVLCNNAAIQGPLAPTEHYDETDFDRVMAVNARGVFLGLRYGIPLMLSRGGGSIVNTASMASLVAFPQLIAYCAL